MCMQVENLSLKSQDRLSVGYSQAHNNYTVELAVVVNRVGRAIVNSLYSCADYVYYRSYYIIIMLNAYTLLIDSWFR